MINDWGLIYTVDADGWFPRAKVRAGKMRRDGRHWVVEYDGDQCTCYTHAAAITIATDMARGQAWDGRLAFAVQRRVR